MKRNKQNKKLTVVFFLFAIILTVTLYIGLHRQLEIIEWQSKSPKASWKKIVKEHLLDEKFDLKFVRSSRIFTRRIYEYLYSRKFIPEQLSKQIASYLESYGIGIGKIEVSEESRDIKIHLTSNERTFAEIICTPDMSTSAGKICIIIDDFGYNLNDVVKNFLNMDIPLTFSIIPGHAYSKQIATLADEAGFEVMIHMPMESKDNRTGEEEYILKRSHSWKEIGERLRKALLEIPQAKGINNHQGSRATESRRIMKVVAEVLRSEKKFFVDSRTSSKSVGTEEMERAGVPVATRTVFIDYENEMEIVQKQMDLLAKKARENGTAIGICHPRENTFDVLHNEIPKLRRKGFDFVFASSVVF